MPAALPFAAFFLGLGLEWSNWGTGRFNWGPRLGSLFFLLFGYFLSGNLLSWIKTGITWAAGWVDTAVTYVLGAGMGDAVAYLVTWLPAAMVGAYWLAALLPGQLFGERMTWRIAWLGLFLPVFVNAIPGPAGDFFTWAFSALAGVAAAIVNGLFHLAGSIPGIG